MCRSDSLFVPLNDNVPSVVSVSTGRMGNVNDICKYFSMEFALQAF